MDKKTMLKLFGDAFLRSMIVLLGIVIVGFGVFFLVDVVSGKGEEKDQVEAPTYSDEELQAMIDQENGGEGDSTTEEVTTEEVTTEALEPEVMDIPSNDKNILVLNSTNTSGLAGGWSDKLIGAGFANVGYGNYLLGMETQTKIYVSQEGMGNDLIPFFSDAVVIVGGMEADNYTKIGGANFDSADIYIVIGNNDRTVQ